MIALWVALAPPLQTHLPLDLTCILLVHLAHGGQPYALLGAVTLGYGLDLLCGSIGTSYALLYLILFLMLRAMNRYVYGQSLVARLAQVSLCSLAQILPALPGGLPPLPWVRMAFSFLAAPPCLALLDRWSAVGRAS